MHSSEFTPFAAAAMEAAESAAAYIASRARDVNTFDWREKGQSDFVSEVDTEAEARIADALGHRIPGCTVMGEELTPYTTGSAGVTFIVDPLDGTTNFLHGYPQYAVSIGAVVDGAIVAGVVLDCVSDERFTATLGGGAWLRSERLSVSRITEPSRALIGTGFPFKHLSLLPQYQEQFARVLRATSGIRRAGSAALDLAAVACGRFDAFWELRLAPWDIAAGLLLVREAGGVATNLEGETIGPVNGPVVAGNPEMHAWLMSAVGGTAV
jgi:myo-inositol-1(or 4)-monophosphatase